MAPYSKFQSVNLNRSYGKTSSSSSTSGYGNGRPRSAGGGGGMVVLSRPRSSSGAAAHKSASRLAVPPPMNLPSLRKEHERLDPASSRPSSGHSGSGLGPGHVSSMGWTKPALPMTDSNDKDDGARALSSGGQRSITGASRSPVLMEKAVILKGEDFPSLLAISVSPSKQKQRQISENSDGWGEKAELPTLLDMRPQSRSSPLIKGNVQGSDGGADQIPYSRGQSRRDDANFTVSLPLVRLRNRSDWDDDERDRSHGFSAIYDRDGRLLLDGEARSTLSWDSGRSDLHGREFITARKEGSVVSSWRVTVQPNRDLSTSRVLHVDRDHVGHRNLSVSRGTSKHSSHARLFNGDSREFGSGVGISNAEVAEDSNDRAEVSNNWQRGKSFSSGVNSKGPKSSGVNGFLSDDPVLNFSKEKLTSNVGKSCKEDASWGGMGPLSSDSLLDSKTKIFRKKKEAMNSTDFFDPVRESFEAELERVQQLQERERQRVMEEQARAIEVARREAEERERIAREEEERRRLLEEEAREAAWRADQEKLEAARRTEEQRIAIKEEKQRILMEEERRKEAARQKLLELEARIAKRQTEANTNDEIIEESDPSRGLEHAEWEKTERTLEPFTISPSSDSSFMNRLSEAAGFTTHSSNVENYLFAQRGRLENNWSQNNNLIFNFQDQEGGYPSSRHDAFSSKRGFHTKQFQGSDGPMPVAPSFKKGMLPDQTETGKRWDRNSDCDQFNGSSNIDAPFQGCDHGHFDGSQLPPYAQRSLQNRKVEDLVSFSRVRHTLRQPRVPPPPSFSTSQLKNSFGAASEGPNLSLSANSDAQSNPSGRKEDSDVQIIYNCGYQQIIPEPTTELLEGTASSLLQTEDKSSPRYDSQSSLSVSSPPSSPTQHSLDEIDDCGGSPTLTASVEEENMIFSDSKHMLTELDAGHMDSEIIPFSHEEDDEWAVDNNEEMQEEEDHHEIHDIYQEDNEAHEGNPGNLQFEINLYDVDAVVEKRDEGMRRSSYVINVCHQLGASANDVLNKDFGHAEKRSMRQGNPPDATTELVFANNSADSLQSKDAFTDEVINATSEEKTDERQEDVGPITLADHSPDNIGATKKSGQHPMTSAAGLPLSSSPCSISTSVLTSQDEMPVRLQFGLFSGPPLIPSPIPTIQIGSIQMPLPLHEKIDSYAQMHSSNPPLFQFGQINRFTPPLSQSSLPISAQTMSFMHPPALAHSSINQNTSSSSSNLVFQGSTSLKILEKGQRSFPVDNQSGFVSDIFSPCAENLDSQQLTALMDVPRNKVLKSQSQIISAASDEKKDVCNLLSPSANPDVGSNKNFRSMVNSRRVWIEPHVESLSSNRKSEVISKAPGTMPEIRGNRFTYNARNTGSLPSVRRTKNSFANSFRHQRRVKRHFQGIEYRVKVNDGARQMKGTDIFNHSKQNEKPNSGDIVVGVTSRNSGRKEPAISKSTKLTDEEAAPGAQVVGAGSNMSRPSKKETLPKINMSTSGNFHGEGILKKNGLLVDDINAPLRSGIVRIFNQPGIEASADGDGFVEVRSKRKMSNERRGQRERETNPKYKIVKVPRRLRSTLSNNRVTSRSDMVTTAAAGAAAKSVHSDPSSVIRRSHTDLEASLLPTTDMTSQKIPLIVTPAMSFTDCDANFKSLKSTQLGSDTDKASDGAKLTPSLSFGNSIIAHDKASVPLGTWGTVHLNQQAITSTLSQLDEPSNPVVSNLFAADKISLDDRKHATSTHEKPSFSSANLLNFPFSGEKIQFGAVALPPTLPSSSQSVSSSIWPPGSVILNASIIHNVPVLENSRSCFFDKEKCSGESCAHLDDTEAEAEAAASAVAVAAISNDEIHVSTLSTGSTSDNGTRGLCAPGVTRFVDAAGQSASEESLVVTLPADLSVDTPHSLWPVLPNIQSSRATFSRIAGPQPSPFPFFDSSPILGGPFRPQDESTGPQAQPQQNAAFGSVPTGTWSQCHSGVDSFYGSPAGFPAPFISPPGGLSGVHGHPQMVFYNHFAPVGQFGQVGLSYMGTTYIPTGEQPDWKHNSEAPTVNLRKPGPSNLNVAYGQQKVAHVPIPAQHLSTGSAVSPVTSPFPMFNLRPFQPSKETSVPAHWPPIPHPSTRSIRLSTAPEQLQSLPLDLHVKNVRLNEPHSAAADLPYELSLLESTPSNSADARTIQPSRKPAAAKSMKGLNGIPTSASSIVSLSEGNGIGVVSSFSIQNMITPQASQQTISPVQQHLGPIGKADQPKGGSLKTSSGSEWRRRNTYPGKHCNVGTDKIIGGSTKLKQIYVVKSLSTGHATSS